MYYLYDFLYFLGQAITIVIAILLIIVGVVAILSRAKSAKEGALTVHKVNKKFRNMVETVEQALLTKHQYKKLEKANKKIAKQELAHPQKKRLFILKFNGDIRASQVTALSEEITAILLTAQSGDEALVCVESPGGIISGYGLAASQLLRLKEAGIPFTIAVDKVAASGGYMMAAVANKIIAAPFALLGSIGVVAQLPNFHRFLKKKDVDFEQITAGEYKRTLSLFGEITNKGREKLQEEVDEAHELFKQFIVKHRPQVNITQLATGEHWFGQRALELKLVDELCTSDSFLLKSREQFDLFELSYKLKTPWFKRLGLAVENLLHFNNV